MGKPSLFKTKRKKMQLFGERLRIAMQTAGIPDPAILAAKLEVSPQIVRKWLKADRPRLSAEHLLQLAVVLSVRAHWLGTGQGPMQRFHASKYTETDMLNTFRQLSERERVMLRDLAGLIFRFSRED